MARQIVVLETPAGELGELSRLLQELPDTQVVEVTAASALIARVQEEPPVELAVLDVECADGAADGLALVAELRRTSDELAIIAVAARGSVEAASKAIAAGASDFLVRGDRMRERVATQLAKVHQLWRLAESRRALLLQNRELSRRAEQNWHMIARSGAMQRLFETVARVAPVPRPVLITGERGTGKELVARAIHEASGLSGPFVTANCAAFSDALLESELFGHEQGAFTGASKRTLGKFELARGGTLFLDEIGNMSLAFQQKILRAVEYGTFLRVGGGVEVRCDVRIVAATNADLRAKIREGAFLADLYDRLAFEVLAIPPLRERPEDVEPLARHFLEQFMREVPGFSGKNFSAAALDLLREYAFPGNVRELKNIVERAVYRDTGNVIDPVDIGIAPDHAAHLKAGNFKQRIEALERDLIESALNEAEGNQAEAARLLGLSYHQFRYYRQKYS